MSDNQQELISQQALRAVMDNVGAFIYIKDLEGRYLYANQKVQDLFGLPLDEIVGKTDDAFFDLAASNELSENDLKVVQLGEVREAEEHNHVKGTHEIRIFWSVKKPLRNDQGQIIGMFGISTDITERKKMELELQQQNDFLRVIMDNIESSIYMVDQHDNLRYANRRLAERFNLPQGDIKDVHISKVVDAQAYELISANNKKVFETGSAERFKERAMTAQGEEQVFWSVKVPHTMVTGERMIIGFSTDMTEMFHLQEKLRRQSTHDDMTQLYNRRFFFSEGEKLLLTAKQAEESSCFLVIDLDYFKNVNDEYGHPVGDEVLVAIAERLADQVRKNDLLARFGGEEFALLLPGTPKDKAIALAEKMRKAIEATPVKISSGESISVTLSVGVYTDPNSSQNFANSYKTADALLYEAKSQGRNRVVSS
ncbi:MAG: diguanylate cyclase [Idiomarina sp.]|nr:diguanylate cyclase [Idiomarina sp.]